MARKKNAENVEDAVELTAEEQAKKEAKREAKKAKREALEFLVNSIIQVGFQGELFIDEKVLDSAHLLKKKGNGGGTSKAKVISEMFPEVGSVVTEDEIFAQFKMGRLEMRKITTNLIKKVEPIDRKWVSFNPETGEYVLEGVGVDAPEGWTGYTPVSVEDIEIM